MGQLGSQLPLVRAHQSRGGRGIGRGLLLALDLLQRLRLVLRLVVAAWSAGDERLGGFDRAARRLRQAVAVDPERGGERGD